MLLLTDLRDIKMQNILLTVNGVLKLGESSQFLNHSGDLPYNGIDALL